MELSQEVKDRIREEERVRMEYRREYWSQSSNCGGRWHGRRFFPFLALVAVLFAAGHFWHHGCGWNDCRYAVSPAAPQAPAH